MAEPWDTPLSPVNFLKRSSVAFADRPAIVDGDYRFTYSEMWDRAQRLAGALIAHGVRPGDRVAVLAPNTRVLLEPHNGVPLAGAVLVALNQRLSANELSYIVNHAEARVLIYDHAWEEQALAIAEQAPHDITLIRADGPDDQYEPMIANAEPRQLRVTDERDLISLNYTSGTTGQPKGVMYQHRGAYLNALSNAFHAGLDTSSVFLWTLPMFHCNGWTFTWATTAAGATHLCMRELTAANVWDAIRKEGVTHFNGAPTVLTMIAHDDAAKGGPAPQKVEAATGGAPPSPTILAEMAELNINVTHLYGLTETYGPLTICQWQPQWNDLPRDEQARIRARQGVGMLASDHVRVLDIAGNDVPADGATMGQVAARGNNLMSGYYKDPEATANAMPGGWFRTGDVGVMHADGYIELKDRSKDIIISGGENISSIEVEQAITRHPSVLEVAVIGEPDETWGEVPVAYVALKPDVRATEEDIINHVKNTIARYKAPRRVVFTELPKTSTGKIQKFVLRDKAWAGHDRHIG
ncbi:MAG: long-chain-fatty-acid--CoA ligase [Acidimicrobiia bacterium]|nr:long-chain-fatty-acid--CoA ligase [Acidimicrobiia bacterium]